MISSRSRSHTDVVFGNGDLYIGLTQDQFELIAALLTPCVIDRTTRYGDAVFELSQTIYDMADHHGLPSTIFIDSTQKVSPTYECTLPSAVAYIGTKDVKIDF